MTLRDFNHSISVIIPAYNEAKRLPETLRSVHAFLQSEVRDFEIIVVDDGSKDNTVAIAQALARELSHIRVIANPHNRGKGAVVRQGLQAARGEFRVFMDADHSTNINELAKLPFLVERADVFASSRYVSGSHVVVPQAKKRIMVSRVANALIRFLAVPGVHDTQNGFKIFRAQVVEHIAPHLTLDRWAFDVEMLYLARRFGYRIMEFPVTWHNSSDSRLNVGRDLRNTASEFSRLLKNILTGRYPRRPQR